MIRILHTADWHLGKRLADTDRTEDFRQFLDWLLELIEAQRIDVLLLSGDVFDTTMPATDAQRLYYEFLSRAARSRLFKTIITAGNHDSQRFLSAPKALLGVMNCVIAGETPDEEALIVHDRSGRPVLGVAAVPYLREGDVRTVGQSTSESERIADWEAGVAGRYREVKALLDERLAAEQAPDGVPRVAMSHLFVTGSDVAPLAEDSRPSDEEAEDARREPQSHFVGTLRNVGAAVFGAEWDYVALGHIHCAQRVKRYAGPGEARYSGAPLALSFRSEHYAHQVVLVEIDAEKPFGSPERIRTSSIPVPQPRYVGRIRGNFDLLKAGLHEAAARSHNGLAPILEAFFTLEGAEARALVAPLRECAEKAGVVLGPIRVASSLSLETNDEALMHLEDITPEEVFEDVLSRQRRDGAWAADAAPASDDDALLRRCFEEAVALARDAIGLRQESARGAGAVAELARICSEAAAPGGSRSALISSQTKANECGS